ncbi:glycosyltransferase [Vibrio algicola]|uniref:Glycosyltransferase n=1 Tax=Vibrio algicola TaxID=2662262 RepID=A0A5Q0TDW6_9VIBR|nr:glycosyltransferase [Vibrio algicola]
MKVAVVVSCLKLGGMERVAVNLADAFAHSGHDSHLMYLKDRKKQIQPRNEAVSLHLFDLKKWVLMTGIGALWFVMCKLLNVLFRKTFPHFFAYAQAIAFRYKLRQLEKKDGRFDLIIFRGQGTFGQIWPMRDKRFVFVCESVQNKNLYAGLSKWIFSSLYENRNVVCVSEGSKASFLDLTKEHQIHCNKVVKISNPNDYQMIRQDALQPIKAELFPPRPYILSLGRLVPLKNISLLIQAYHYARHHFGLEQDLVIVGEGKDREQLEKKVAELGLTQYVFFKGAQSNPFPWYKQADLFVLSSKSEGLGMVLIEALACGVKVVSTDCPGGVRDIMQGKLIQFLAEQNASSLAEKIHLALEPSPNKPLKDDIDKALINFDQEFIVKQYRQEFIL